MSQTSSYVCDTLPAARLATASDVHTPDLDDDETVSIDFDPPVIQEESVDVPAQNEPETDNAQGPPPRKLCVRHQRMADEGTNLKLQESLDALPEQERVEVNAIWTAFSSSSHPRRAIILQGLLTMCCFSQLSLLTEQLAHLIRIDPFTVLPEELSLRVLRHLDAISLCRAAQVSKKWRGLAEDDVLWRGICEQHIGQKCGKCGWSLPVLEKRAYRLQSTSPSPSPDRTSLKRRSSDTDDLNVPSAKRPCPDPPPPGQDVSIPMPSPGLNTTSPFTLMAPTPRRTTSTRPWKDVYSERMTIERNWRRGRYTTRTLKGHSDGVMCLQFNENLSHPQFPVLITGSYDRTARVWNLETGAELHCLRGHLRAVRALQFDEVKLITGSMDNTLKIWDWRRGTCIRTLPGHSEGVVCLNFDSNVLASGSVDTTVKVWNLRTGVAFTLRGHSDWVNAVVLWDSNSSSGSSTPTIPPTMENPGCPAAPQIDPGKMLFSASDDGMIKLWDLTTRSCVRQFTGHVGQVQSLKLLLSSDCDEEESNDEDSPTFADAESIPSPDNLPEYSPSGSQSEETSCVVSQASRRSKPMLISGSLDNTIKIWDIDTGKPTRTYFGHIEGVWGVASDKTRLVSGSHDRTIKVWRREDDKCTATLIGHRGAVSCVALGEDKIVSGSDDSDIIVWSFT